MLDRADNACGSCGYPEGAGHAPDCTGDKKVHVAENAERSVESSPDALVARSSLVEWRAMNGLASSDSPSTENSSVSEKIAMYDAVFRAGARKLLTELRDSQDAVVKLIDKLEIPKLKSELGALRQQGDMAALGKKEQEIACLFQQAISEYAYEGSTCHVAEILDKKQMNCVGASVLGGMLLGEVGIQYVTGDIGSHFLLIVTTSDGRVLWQDMQDGKEKEVLYNEELTAEKIEGKKEDGEHVVPDDVVSFSRQPKNEGVTFFVKKADWQNKPMTILPPEFGLELQVLINTGFMLGNRGKGEEAIEILTLARHKAPKNCEIYHGLARAYRGLGRYNEAIDACHQALEIDPTDVYLKNLVEEIRVLAGAAV